MSLGAERQEKEAMGEKEILCLNILFILKARSEDARKFMG
jgi:hypothetical protein